MTSRCEYCGKELPTRSFTPFGMKPVTVTLPCDCEKALEAKEREQREIDRAEMAEVLKGVWERSGVPNRFRHVKADFGRAAPLFDGKWLYICGENGRGKTYAACQAAKAYLIRNTRRDVIYDSRGEKRGPMRCRVSFHFTEAQGLLSEVSSSWDRWDMSEGQVKSRWAGVDLLILDDLGKGVPTEWAAETLFDVLNQRWSSNNDRGEHRFRDRLTIITSQYDIRELSERYKKAGNETLGAMISRLEGECDTCRLDGPDRRTERV